MSLDKGGFGNFPGFVAQPPETVSSKPARTAGFTVPMFWGGDRVTVLVYDSVDYVLRPGEITLIEGTFKHARDAMSGKILFESPLVRNLGPDEVAKGLMDLYGERGVRALTGNPVIDERIKVEARNTYLPWRRAECELIVANHENDCAMALAAKHRPPRPTFAWREAKQDLDRFEAMGAEGKRFVVTKDGTDFETEGEAFAWVRSNYRGTDPKSVVLDTRSNDPKPEDVVVKPEEVAEEPAKRSRRTKAEMEQSRMSQADPLEAQKTAIFMQAGRDGVALTSEIIEGLKSGDRETVEAAIEAANEFLNGGVSK